VKAADGTQNMMVWELGIPGKQGVSSRLSTAQGLRQKLMNQTNWEGGVYKVLATFPEGKPDHQ
jgi:hypothetical protein